MIKITISRGSCSSAMLADPTFCEEWANLCSRCPWSTAYQLPEFAAVWYRIYSRPFEPLLITGRNEKAELVGILCLAVSRDDGRVSFAGTSQPEYQTWVCDPEVANVFALEALLAARAMFPAATLEFRYLPPSVPLGWLEDPRVKGFTLLTTNPQPLIRFAAISTNPLAKINNKTRLKRLEREGALAFDHLTEVVDLEAVIDELAFLHDLRHLVMYGSEPFALDPLKKQFWLELMRRPGLLHVTTLKAGDRLASVHVNVCDGRQVHLNLIAHNPLLAKHSPGKFHIHLLSKMLISEAFEEIDLTPGGDPYKERFANAHDTAFALSFFPTRRGRLEAYVRARADHFARKGLGAVRAHPARAKAAWRTVAELPVRQIAPALLARIATKIRRPPKSIVYVVAIPQNGSPDVSSRPFHIGDARDLMAYRPNAGDISRRRFLSAATQRLEQGQHLFSYTESGRLLQIGWLIDRPSDRFLSRNCPGLSLPPRHALLTGFESLCKSRGMELSSACVAAILNDLRRRGIEGAAMAVPADQTSTIRILEMAGFRAEARAQIS